MTLVKYRSLYDQIEPESPFSVRELPPHVGSLDPEVVFGHPSEGAQVNAYVLGVAWFVLSFKLFLIS